MERDGLICGSHQSELETQWPQRGTSLMRNSFPLGPYSRPMPGALCWFTGGWVFLMSEVPLFMHTACRARAAAFQILLKLSQDIFMLGGCMS